MNKAALLLSIMVIPFIFTGCAKEDAGIGDEDNALRGNEMETRNMRTEENQSTQFGYVRYNQKQLDMDDEQNKVPQMNREEMANMITRTLLKLPDIEEAATLVTDEEAFIAFTKAEDVEIERAVDTVKRTAKSILPVWVDVYVSDNPAAYSDLQSYSNNNVKEAGDERGIMRLIRRFQSDTPQGKDYNTTEQ